MDSLVLYWFMLNNPYLIVITALTSLDLWTISIQTIDWEALLTKRAKPPFLPSIKESVDVSNFDSEFTRLQPVLSPPPKPFSLSAEQQEAFADFDFWALHGWKEQGGGETTSRYAVNIYIMAEKLYLSLHFIKSWFTKKHFQI